MPSVLHYCNFQEFLAQDTENESVMFVKLDKRSRSSYIAWYLYIEKSSLIAKIYKFIFHLHQVFQVSFPYLIRKRPKPFFKKNSNVKNMTTDNPVHCIPIQNDQ